MPQEINVEEWLCSISEKAQLAMLLDILTPKPGNVHRYKDHHDTRLVHFAASIARLAHPIYQAARWGYQRNQSLQGPSKLGELNKLALQASMKPHRKNTLLGTILLIIPLTVAAGYEIPRPNWSPSTIRQSLSQILYQSSIDDALELIRTLQIANPGGAKPKTPQWTEESQAFDFQSPRTIELIRREKYTLIDLQSLAAPFDAIAEEYTTDFGYIFDQLYPRFLEALNQHSRVEDAVLISYLWALGQRPDTFIQRKAGPDAAQQVTKEAHKLHNRILHLPEDHWQKELNVFDDYLRSQGSRLNPGTTADLISAAVFLALLLDRLKLIF
ncbi:MAG: triphosphoribosyl-dephospho-CoA synthase [Promethearchaeota archaeon]